MDSFEKHLAKALRPPEPPESLARNVLGRVRERDFRTHRVYRYAAAAVLLIVVAGAFGTRAYQRRVEGERAKEQVMLALRVTGSTLREVQQRVSEKTLPANSPDPGVNRSQ